MELEQVYVRIALLQGEFHEKTCMQIPELTERLLKNWNTMMCQICTQNLVNLKIDPDYGMNSQSIKINLVNFCGILLGNREKVKQKRKILNLHIISYSILNQSVSFIRLM